MNIKVKFIIILVSISTFCSYSQEGIDIVAPKQSEFQPGKNIEGWVRKSINEPTGKVAFSLPITSISARGVSYNVSLSYDGKSAFDIGSYTNKYYPTSTVGVGFTLSTPKIVVDNKNTATKEDDTFYLLDGNSNSKLQCIGIAEPSVGQEGDVIWSFETEKYMPWKIKYHKSDKFDLHGVLIERPLDYWVLTDDNGIQYHYGKSQNSRENLVAWGNWIGNSNKVGGNRTRETIVWNLSKIKDQWGNNLEFEYEHQESTIGGIPQTEAAYLSKIKASTGEYIDLIYDNKIIYEYLEFESNREEPEPDAYQERYEKKYLNHINTYDSKNNLKFKYDLIHTNHNQSTNNPKRYLTMITQEDVNGVTLPSQKFEYYTDSDFKGGLQKITYPTGGSVNYTYKNKKMFTNTHNLFTGEVPSYEGYYYHSMIVRDNYSLLLLKETQQSANGKFKFKLVRHWWNGMSWERNVYDIPFRIRDNYPGNPRLEDFYPIFGENFYGFLYKEGSIGSLELFHLKDNGTTWKHSVLQSPYLGGDNTPKLMSGNNFVAIGTHREGKIHIYDWTNDTWKLTTINQGNGSHEFGGTNNFIISINRKQVQSDTDFVTGTNGEDFFYIHYRDIKGNWQSKSWSNIADPFFNDISDPSYFYPNNAMSGFVVDNNREMFLRWDKNYNLIGVDDVLGAFNDSNPITPTYSGMFALQNGRHSTQRPYRLARFNGIDWNVHDVSALGNFRAMPSYGEDKLIFQNYGNSSTSGIIWYNANNNDWYLNTNLGNGNGTPKISGITKDFFVSGQSLFDIPRSINKPIINRPLTTITNHKNRFTYSDGIDNIFTEIWEETVDGNITGYDSLYSLLINTNKKTNEVHFESIGNWRHPSSAPEFAGYTPFLSTKSLWTKTDSSVDPNTGTRPFVSRLYRIINNKVNQNVNDIVVNNIAIDNNEGKVRNTLYTFDNPNPTADNNTVFYDTVTIEEKGFFSFANNGKIVKTYNSGTEDTRLSGLLLEEKVYNSISTLVSKTTNDWRNFILPTLSHPYRIQLLSQKSSEYYEDKELTNIITNDYDAEKYYRLHKSSKINSKRQTEIVFTNYADDKYLFMKEANYANQPYEVIKKLTDKIISVNRTNWIQDNDKIYPKSKMFGIDVSSIRLVSENSKLSSYGQVVESNNGRGQYNTVLYGYQHQYPIVSISNVSYADVISKLDISLEELQNLNNENLKIELLKLYDRLPKSFINITLYDSEGKILEEINQRKEIMTYKYDTFNRLTETFDLNGKLLEKKIYNYKLN